MQNTAGHVKITATCLKVKDALASFKRTPTCCSKIKDALVLYSDRAGKLYIWIILNNDTFVDTIQRPV